MIPVKDNHALYRDEESNAIISTDVSEHQKYIESRNRKKSERAERLENWRENVKC